MTAVSSGLARGSEVILRSCSTIPPCSRFRRHRRHVLLVDDGDDAVQRQIAERMVQEARNGLGGVPHALVFSGEGDTDLSLPPVFLGLQTAVPDKLPTLFQLHGELEPRAGR